MKKWTKGAYKKRKHEIGRTSKALSRKQGKRKATLKGLEDKIWYGALKDKTFKQIIDENFYYFVKIKDSIAFKSEVRLYFQDVSKKIDNLRKPLRYKI